MVMKQHIDKIFCEGGCKICHEIKYAQMYRLTQKSRYQWQGSNDHLIGQMKESNPTWRWRWWSSPLHYSHMKAVRAEEPRAIGLECCTADTPTSQHHHYHQVRGEKRPTFWKICETGYLEGRRRILGGMELDTLRGIERIRLCCSSKYPVSCLGISTRPN